VATVASTPTAAKSAAPPPKPLCEGQWTERAFVRPVVVTMTADGVRGKGAAWRPPTGKWTWVNLFASWCGPCKEEIPRLRRWEKQAGFALVFLSLDDDERELQNFMRSPLGPEVGQPIWLKDDHAREKWLAEMQIKNPPNLPVQVLVDPQGKVRCVSQGAVEEGDIGIVREKLR